MKISHLRISNFRCYQNKTTIKINDLTCFVGKNDIGKSTILEAMDIFFNESKRVIKIDTEDINKLNLKDANPDIEITVVFEDVPQEIIIDATNKTTLESEYLLNKDKKLEIVKRYQNAGKEKVFIKAWHPSNINCSDLLLKKQNDLRKIIKEKSIHCTDNNKNSIMRKAIWGHYSDELEFKEVEIDVTKEDAKKIWEKLKSYMPLYFLFQSDRKNSDGDDEVQDPMKLTVQQSIKSAELQPHLKKITDKVYEDCNQVAMDTLREAKRIDPEIANEFKVFTPPSDILKWADVFKNISIHDDKGISINNRGSGVRRLVSLSFFITEVERRKKERGVPNIIYAVEEPETSQHPENQKKLITALLELSKIPHVQVILTTHSPSIVKMLDFGDLKLIYKSDNLAVEVRNVEKKSLPFPSLNEVNFLAFDEFDEGYHGELYGFIEDKKWLKEFEVEKELRDYRRKKKNGKIITEQITLSEYIRHQIHHPENKLNKKYTREELKKSIELMREFIQKKRKSS